MSFFYLFNIFFYLFKNVYVQVGSEIFFVYMFLYACYNFTKKKRLFYTKYGTVIKHRSTRFIVRNNSSVLLFARVNRLENYYRIQGKKSQTVNVAAQRTRARYSVCVINCPHAGQIYKTHTFRRTPVAVTSEFSRGTNGLSLFFHRHNYYINNLIKT